MLSSKAIFCFILVVLALLPGSEAWKQARTFRFKNNAGKTIWIGGFGVPLMAQTGWEMPPGA